MGCGTGMQCHGDQIKAVRNPVRFRRSLRDEASYGSQPSNTLPLSRRLCRQRLLWHQGASHFPSLLFFPLIHWEYWPVVFTLPLVPQDLLLELFLPPPRKARASSLDRLLHLQRQCASASTPSACTTHASSS